ncbi:AmmeMemoRadiSam system protein B [Candidatus Kuenenbacteria bacterium]|nr:AmmeMemoRadiSam system protein B [Candidatus Kuenenbacteria bacterium]
MIKFAALCPHPPLAIPAIGQNNITKLETTINSLQKINDELISIKPDTLVIISPHNQSPSTEFSVNASPKYFGSLENFGDLATKLELAADTELAEIIGAGSTKNTENFDIKLINEEKIDYGATIPLFYLTQDIIGLKILAIHPTISYDPQKNYNFGKHLQKIFKNSDKKIAIVASGDLSHKISGDSPAGTSPRAKEFDHTLIKSLKRKKINEILSIDESLSKEAEECGLKPIAILLGALHHTAYTPQILSYEHPFGIGYLTAEMILKN